MIEIDASEVTQLAATLAAAGPRAERVSSEVMTKVAAQLRDDAKSAAPVDTGDLRNSIHVQGGQDYRRVVADAPHAFYVEFGTNDTAPQSFMWSQVGAVNETLSTEFAKLGDPFEGAT